MKSGLHLRKGSTANALTQNLVMIDSFIGDVHSWPHIKMYLIRKFNSAVTEKVLHKCQKQMFSIWKCSISVVHNWCVTVQKWVTGPFWIDRKWLANKFVKSTHIFRHSEFPAQRFYYKVPFRAVKWMTNRQLLDRDHKLAWWHGQMQVWHWIY